MMLEPAVKQPHQALIAAMRGLMNLNFSAERVSDNSHIAYHIDDFVPQRFLVKSQLLVGMKTSGSEHNSVL